MTVRYRPNQKIKILSLDGGTHGFTWLFCLREIEEDNPGFLAQTDVFTGSSFGGFCSLYLARHLGSLREGESAVPIIEGCLAFMHALLSFDFNEAAAARFREGMESMYSHERMEQVLTDPRHLGDARLGDLQRRVIISTMGTKRSSWAPTVYDSATEEDRTVRASEVGLESAALPLMLPIRNGLTNGSLGGANGSLHGLTRVVEAGSRVSLDDVTLFSLGGDPQTSSLANFPTPWDGLGSIPPKLSLDAVLQPSPESAQALALLNQKIDQLWQELETHVPRATEPAHAKPQHGFDMMRPREASSAPGQRSVSWGWRQWLTYASSPLFMYQVITNNQALDTAEHVRRLLGQRSFRLAPMALLSSGQVLFMTFFANAAASTTITRAAELTAELWGDAETSRAFQFTPCVEDTEAFIDTHWMPRGRAGRGKRRAGWRRARQRWTLGPQ